MAIAPWLFAGAGAVLVAASLDVFRRQPALFTFTLVVGAGCWLAGSALWAVGNNVHSVVAWWLAFLILTIAGERLELSRFMAPSTGATGVFGAILLLLSIGLIGSTFGWGSPLFPAGLVALAAWLVRHDIARRTIRGTGLTRYIAVCLLAGYAWLAIGGLVALVAGGFSPGSTAYDAALHALALGFVFSMVFGHAPIIFPAVLRVAVPYHPGFYVPLALLHGTLIVRLAGDAAGLFEWTRIGGFGNALALLAFIAGTATAVVRGRRLSARA